MVVANINLDLYTKNVFLFICKMHIHTWNIFKFFIGSHRFGKVCIITIITENKTDE